MAATLGKYRLLRCIGVGGMAEVYEARRADDPTTRERLALKVLLPQHVHEMEIVKSFIDEATIASGLSHPNVVSVVDYGCVEEQYFIAMEHIDGWDLNELIGLGQALGRPMPVPAAAYIIHELSRALDYIHTRPLAIVHRDVTPHNVFVDRAGRVKLSDFGVAKTAVRWSQTYTGLIKGKLHYLAPEQVRGEPVSPRTDIYCTGLVLFELLTGQRYSRSSTESGLLSRAHDPDVVLPSRLNPGAAPLDDVIRGALQHDPAMRTRDAALLVDQTRRLLQRFSFNAAEMARLAERLQREAGAAETTTGEPTIPERLRPEPIAGVPSGELVLEQTERTQRTERTGPPDGLGPEAALDAVPTSELAPEKTLRTGPPEPLAPDPPAAPERPGPAPAPAPTRSDGAHASRVTARPGPQESGLIRLLHEPADQPLQVVSTSSDLPLPGAPAEQSLRWGWLVVGAVAALGLALLLIWALSGGGR